MGSYSQYWLLVYEIANRGWLGIKTTTLDTNIFFSVLKDRSISFFDISDGLQPIKVKRSLLNKVYTKLSQVEKSLRDIKVTQK